MAFKITATGDAIWLPDEERPVFGKCTVIVACTDDGEKTYCGTPLYSRQEFERHTARCARQHMAEIRKASLRERMPAFHDPEQAGIPDVESWLRKVDTAGESNRRKVIDGRLKM